jgi:hypothetical protein
MDQYGGNLIDSQLTSGERLLWSGRPQQGLVFRLADAIAVPFSLLWGGFACFWEYSVVSSGAPFFFALWGIPFVAVGLYLIAGRFFVDARQRAHTFYGVTNQRIILVSGMASQKIKSLNLRTLSDVTLDQKANGPGTISFGASPLPAWFSAGVSWPGMPTGPAFELIENAKDVFDVIRKAQATAK